MKFSHGARRWFRPIGTAIARFPSWIFTRSVQFLIDVALASLAIVIAFLVRFDGIIPLVVRENLWSMVLVVPTVRALTVRSFGGHRTIWRYFSLSDALQLSISALPCTVVMVVLRYAFAPRYWFARIPMGVIAIECGAFVLLATFIRVFRRVTCEAALEPERTIRALIVGTGETIAAAARHLAGYGSIRVIGLLATEDSLVGLVIGGHRVIGTTNDLESALASETIDLVLISDAGLSCLGNVVEVATNAGIDIRLLPSAANVLHGSVRVSALVAPERAVERPFAVPEEMDAAVVKAYIDRRVLVTGAGGSIGSELCRQISRLPVASLILLDRDENSIFEMSNELSGASGSKIVPLVGDIRDGDAMQRLFESHRPHIVLHAAAYKHVPVMERNCSEAVLNNVIGTREVAERAFAFGAERFLMISTDKAVHPTSVMGATKKIAEQIVQSMGNSELGMNTRCSCVRFGNVVGSRGSVVPIFLRQIAAGGPVTITDENMTRYFMTIPEAVQLVLQASTLGSAGDVYMLDMGDPVKITDMARRLIVMSGLRPDKDIQTKVVGTRPGEKMHEQLFGEDAEVRPTELHRIFSVRIPLPDGREFGQRLKNLEEAAKLRDDTLVRQCLDEMRIGFQQPGVAGRVARSSG